MTFFFSFYSQHKFPSIFLGITAFQNCGLVTLLLYILRFTADSIASAAFFTATTLWSLGVHKSVLQDKSNEANNSGLSGLFGRVFWVFFRELYY